MLARGRDYRAHLEAVDLGEAELNRGATIGDV